MSNKTAQAVEALNKGGVILVPTDTVFGLAVSPLFPTGVDKLYTLKMRPRHMNLPIMVANEKQLEELGVELNQSSKNFLRSDLMPGALTLIFGFTGKPKVDWLAGREEIAVRIPDDAQLLEILESAGPLLVTSANIHGKNTEDKAEAVLKQLNGAPDYVVEGTAKDVIPSTIVNCRLSPPKIERLGIIPEETVRQYYA